MSSADCYHASACCWWHHQQCWSSIQLHPIFHPHTELLTPSSEHCICFLPTFLAESDAESPFRFRQVGRCPIALTECAHLSQVLLTSAYSHFDSQGWGEGKPAWIVYPKKNSLLRDSPDQVGFLYHWFRWISGFAHFCIKFETRKSLDYQVGSFWFDTIRLKDN